MPVPGTGVAGGWADAAGAGVLLLCLALPARVEVALRVVLSIHVLLLAQRIGQDTGQRVLGEEAAVGGVVIPGAQVERAALGVLLLAREAQG